MRQVPYAVQVVRFIEGFALVSLSGEVTPANIQKIRKSLHERDVMVACCVVETPAAAPIEGESEERVLDAVTRAWKRAGKR